MSSLFFEKYKPSEVTSTRRVIHTPDSFARNHFFYIQEAGYLKSLKPHLSHRSGLDSYLFLIVLSGEGTVSYAPSAQKEASAVFERTGNAAMQVFKASEGDTFFLDCSKEYSHISSGEHPWELLWIHFNGPEAAAYYEYFQRHSLWHLHPSRLGELTGAIDHILTLAESRNDDTDILVSQQITNILTILSTGEQRGSKGSQLQEKLSNVKAYLDSHCTENISLDLLAERFFISKFYLAREFKKEYGITMIQYLTAKKISYAKELLRYSSYSIEEIASLSGIGDASYFNKIFRRIEKCTASEYRRKW